MDNGIKGFEEFEKYTSSIWANALVSEFYKQNELVYKHLKSQLETPNFAITNTRSHWGSWELTTRTISISSELVRNYRWDAVIHTLKHEVAHMIVDEIFKGQYTAHGEAFKKACDVMGIDDDTRHSSAFKESYSLPEKDKIVDKIYKLFALGESSFEHESKIAIAKAYELMVKYNITSINPNQEKLFTCRPVGLGWVKIPSYIKSLARIIKDYYFVKHIYMHCFRGKRIEFFGEPHNLDIAEYVFHYLILEGERKWKEFQQTKEYKNRHMNDGIDYGYRRSAVYSKVSFLNGLYDGFAETLKTQEEVVGSSLGDNCKALVQQNDKILEDNFNKKYHPKSWSYGRSGGNGGGYHTGRNAGKSITIRSGVARRGARGSLQLSA